MDCFPTSVGVAVTPPFLIVYYHSLPPKPWPLCVAGLPVFITSEQYYPGFGFERCGGRTKVLLDYDSRCGVTKELFSSAIAFFENDLKIFISSIVNLAGRWIITVPEGTELSQLPWVIAHSPCSYEFAGEEPDHREVALRDRVPDGIIWDSSSYQELRPGIMVSCGKDNEGHEFLTTSGVALEDSHGSRFFTVASHGFPLGSNVVYHPSGNGITIGTIVKRIKDSDVAVARLVPSAQYRNETFAAELEEEFIPATQINGIRKAMDVANYTPVSMNNPFSGHRDGLHIGSGLLRVPSDEASTLHHWVETQWCYYGNGVEPAEGSCGSAVIDGEGNVISFFRFLLKKYPGCGLGVSAAVLEDAGYRVCRE